MLNMYRTVSAAINKRRFVSFFRLIAAKINNIKNQLNGRIKNRSNLERMKYIDLVCGKDIYYSNSLAISA